MGPLTVILGSPLKDSAPGKIRLVTPGGDVLSIDKKDVVHSGNADAGGDLKRYAVSADAGVTIELTGAALQGVDFTTSIIILHRIHLPGMSNNKSADDKSLRADGQWHF